MAITARNFFIILSKNSSKRVIQKTAETSGDLIGNKTDDKISKILLHKNTEKLQMKATKKCLKKDMYLQKRARKLLLI